MLFACIVIGCAETPMGYEEFHVSWGSAPGNSAVSFWYVGESDTTYSIEERWPTKSVNYVVKKDRLRLVGIELYSVGSGEAPTNLKESNVEFIDNAT
jgi:hypothetical protein